MWLPRRDVSAFPLRGTSAFPLCRGCQLRQDAVGELLAEFHAPLVKAVDAPQAALHRHLVFVERDQPAEAERVELAEQDGVGRMLAGGDTMRGDGVDIGLG